MLDLRKLGALVALERNRKGWSQRELRDRLASHGFNCTAGYVGGVEKGSLSPSREFAVAAEKALETEKGKFLMYLVANHVEKFCNDLHISLQDYMNMIGSGIKSLVAPFESAAETDSAERSVHPAHPRPTLVTKKVSRRRSIMTTQSVFKYAVA